MTSGRHPSRLVIGACGLALLLGCRASADDPSTAAPPVADVVSVTAEGEPGAYRFAVGLRSPDEGCHRYADWWEVVAADGRLVHRRVLAHSHRHEQPFVRAGGPVAIDPGAVVWVRGHMHPTGYGGAVFRGSVDAGFAPAAPPAGFAAGLAERPPRPPECAG